VRDEAAFVEFFVALYAEFVVADVYVSDGSAFSITGTVASIDGGVIEPYEGEVNCDAEAGVAKKRGVGSPFQTSGGPNEAD
jgi:hypothetical protein